MEVTIHNVPITHLALKIAAYRLLFGRNPVVSITGSFKKDDYSLYIVENEILNIEMLDGSNLYIHVDGKWVAVEPLFSTIKTIVFS